MSVKVLAIDDSRTIRELLRSALVAEGFTYECAVDGMDGVEKFSDFDPDVVITDINMPKLEGVGVVDTVRGEAVGATDPVVVLTAEYSGDKKARARAAGATGWMVKPFDDDSLISVLRRVTG